LVFIGKKDAGDLLSNRGDKKFENVLTINNVDLLLPHGGEEVKAIGALYDGINAVRNKVLTYFIVVK